MRPFALICAAALLGALLAAPFADASLGDDSNWTQTRFYPFGADTEVWSSLVYQGDLVISGNFRGVDDAVAPGVARWDGNQWVGYPGIERGGLLVEWNGQLAVVQAWALPGPAGTFDYTAFQIQTWNGSSWDTSSPIAQFTGVSLPENDRVPQAAAAYDGKIFLAPLDDLQANCCLEVGGTNARLASWDGSTWDVAVPNAPGADSYSVLKTWNGQLLASGIGEGYNMFIDAWDGSSWTRQWSSTSGAMVVGFGEDSGSLYAARNGSAVLHWDGATWSPYGLAVSAYAVSGSPEGLAVGGFDVRAWSGSSWDPLGGLAGGVNDLMEFSGDLVASGDFPGHVSFFDGAEWRNPGKQTGRGLDGEIYALASYGNQLFAAGDMAFPGSAGKAAVARWNGVDWQQELSGFTARSLAAYQGNLVAAGAEISEWDGTTWNSLGSAGNGQVHSLCVYGSNLVAGGDFSSVDGVPSEGLAVWNGSAWSELGGGITSAFGSVDALTVWNGLLIVAGDFTEVNGQQLDYIASWNGSQWKDLEPPGNNPPVVTGKVTALAVYNGDLVASGEFFGGTDVIAVWDGHGWSPLGSGLDAAPQALFSSDGFLFASGKDLSNAGGSPVNRIAAWDGSAWNAMGSGLEHPRLDRGGYTQQAVHYSRGWAFAEHQGFLYVGGNFRTAGGKPANHLAMWASPTSVGVPVDPPVKQAFAVKPGLPNPCRSTSRIPLSIPVAGHVTAEVFDIAGRNLGTILDRELPAGDNTVVWNPRSMRTRSGAAISAGAYFIRVSALGEMRSQKVVYIP